MLPKCLLSQYVCFIELRMNKCTSHKSLIHSILYVNILFLTQQCILDFLPPVQNYSYPEVYGMKGTRNFYIDTDDNVTLGVW